ncbi:MAG: NUDIX hydrolase [Clostridia bacterium]|nr:NUDIX hydrolase [Clostridia bacterium]
MLVRNCAGGVVFYNDRVFLLKNEKGEWVLPKGVMRNGDMTYEVALQRVKEETGISAEIVSPAGRTSYEFFSVSRQRPVCNKITWYIMKSPTDKYIVNHEDKFTDGGFFEIQEAMNLVTYSQDKSLVYLSFKRFKEQAS